MVLNESNIRRFNISGRYIGAYLVYSIYNLLRILGRQIWEELQMVLLKFQMSIFKV